MLKRATALFVLSLLILPSFVVSIQAASASANVSTQASVEITSSSYPPQVGQMLNITLGVQPLPPTTDDQLRGITLSVQAPDATMSTLGPFSLQLNSTQVYYTPTQYGIYTFVLQYPGQSFANGTIYLPTLSPTMQLLVPFPLTPTPNPTGATPPPAPKPVITSVSPIAPTCLQTIRIQGSGFGNTQPVTMNLGDGSIDTVGGGRDLPGYGGTPVIQIHDDNPASNPWQAGVQDGPTTGSCSIGIFLIKWSDTEIVLGGFGSALSSIPGQREWAILPGDAMRIVVITVGGMATYNTSVTGTSYVPPTLLAPTLEVSCQSSTSGTNFKVTVNGNLTYNGTGVSGEPMQLSFSVNGGASWSDLTLVDTDVDGEFTAVWTPLVTGNFLIKAAYSGNATFAPTAATVSLVVTPAEDENVFSVSSNSTVSGFFFDSASRQLSFTVTGDSGTTGFVDLYVFKSVLADASNLKVNLDGAPVNFTCDSQGDSWRVSFSYHHSTHSVNISLGSAAAGSTPLGWVVVCGAVLAFAAATIGLVALKRRKNKPDS